MNRGYTTVEVLMSLAILGVGAAGALSLQKVALLGNTDARLFDAAQKVGSTWAAEMEADALLWNDPLGSSDIAETRFLSASTQSPAIWLLPPEIAGSASPTSDIDGAFVFASDSPGRTIFCTHLRLTPAISAPDGSPGAPRKTAMLVDIRISFRRDRAPMTECRKTSPAQIEAKPDRYRFHRLPPLLILQKEAT